MSETTNIVADIKKLLDRKPFIPFSIILNTGERYEVVGPHRLAIGAQLGCGDRSQGGPILF
jgi:hypothetical protein